MTRAREFADLAGSADAGGITGKNLIINGAMQVAQRGTSFSDTGTATEGFYTLDMFHFQKVGLDEMRFTASQDSLVPSGQGFANSLKIAVTTAETSLADNEYFRFRTRVEAQNLQHLAYNTSSAKPLTLSFWIRSGLAGKYSILFFKEDDGSPYRSNTPSFTVSAANTWEKKTITIDGDTGGVIDDDNGYGLSINFQLATGADYAGTPHAGWGTYSITDDYSHSDQVNFVSNTYTMYITGIQLEVGDKATPFEHRSFADELRRCQRYFQRVEGTIFPSMKVNGSSSGAITTSNILLPIFNGVMRAEPTLTGANITLRSEAGCTTATVTGLVSSAHEQSLVTATHDSADTTAVTQLRSDYIEMSADL